MGYGTWTNSAYTDYAKTRGFNTVSINGVDTISGDYSVQQLYHSHNLDSALDPKGVVRECCDSNEHPNTIPVILALDVTGSMGNTAISVAKKLNEIMTNLYEEIPDIQFMTMGIGDLAYDSAPIQASQFEADIRIAEQRQAEAERYRREQDAEAQKFEAEQSAAAKKAEAEAERFSKEQEAVAVEAAGLAEAAAIKAKGNAEAEATKAKLLAEAEGLKEKAEAMKQYGEAAKMQMQLDVIKTYFEQLPKIAEGVANGYQNVDSIKMYGGDSSALTGNIINSVTQISDGLSESLGVDLKSLLAGFLGGKMLGNDSVTINVDDKN